MNEHETAIEEKPLKGVSLKTIWAIIASTAVILGYMTNIKNSINDVAHTVDLIKQDNGAQQQVINLKLDMMQKQIDGNSTDIKRNSDEIEKLKLSK